MKLNNKDKRRYISGIVCFNKRTDVVVANALQTLSKPSRHYSAGMVIISSTFLNV